jgi:hypothetical protein
MKTAFGRIVGSREIETNGKTRIILDVLNPKTYAADSVFLSQKSINYLVAGDAEAPDVSHEDIVGKYITASFHQKGDVLRDGTTVTESDKIVNNLTVRLIDPKYIDLS